MNTAPTPWLLLIHRLPARTPYLRVKVWRRLQAVGALSIQNAVYVLPNRDDCREHFEWVVREIQRHGGEASICEARLVEGYGDEELRAAFAEIRERDYGALVEEVQKLLATPLARRKRSRPLYLAAEVQRLRRQKAEIDAIDFFTAPGGDALERVLSQLEARIATAGTCRTAAGESRWKRSELRGRTWVTRKGIHIDRIASAWLIRTFIDGEAGFKFVSLRGYQPEPAELRFDMYDAEFTHDGELCTFEVLLRELDLSDPTLRAIADIVHAIDLKEEEPRRPETVGIAHLIEGIARRHAEDEARLRAGTVLFDALHAYFRRAKEAKS